MIKNILFDMGNVLIRWEPALFAARLGLGGEDAALLRTEVFGDVEWVQLDRGSISEKDAWASMCARLPGRLHGAAWELMSHWDDDRISVDGMCGLVEELHDNGYGLYLLTNAGLRHHEYWPGFPASRFFGDRIMLSSEWGLLKPEAAFFEKALDMFGLEAGECVFVDDSQGNVEAALRLGIDSVVFHGDPARLRRQLRERGVRINP